MKNPLNIEKGDKITIAAMGLKVKGTVTSVNYYDYTGYYIELTDANVPGGYSYWKQRDDGGMVIEINGRAMT